MSITQTGGTAATWKLVRDMHKRRRALMSHTMEMMATETRLGLQKRLPNRKEWRPLKKSFRTAELVDLGFNKFGSAIFADPKKFKLRGVEGPNEIVYVHVSPAAAKKYPELGVLRRFQPWTAGKGPSSDIPFVPDRRFAKLTFRRVSKKVVERVAKARSKDQPKWREMLRKSGMRGMSGLKRAAATGKGIRGKIHPGYQSLDLEYGMNGMPAVPHWRPTLIHLRGKGMRKYMEKAKGYLTDPESVEWERKPFYTSKPMRMKDAMRFRQAQNALGLSAD